MDAARVDSDVSEVLKLLREMIARTLTMPGAPRIFLRRMVTKGGAVKIVQGFCIRWKPLCSVLYTGMILESLVILAC